MDRRVCSCRKWELTGIPCKQVVVAIHNMSENGKGVVQSLTIQKPLVHKTQIGRPPKKRKKSVDEIASQNSLTSGARNGSNQAVGSSQKSAAPSQVVGAMNKSNQADGSSQHSATPSQGGQGLS
ncbi:hypothetical protein Tco_0371402 [Tanacetum coccineum]